MRMNQPMGLNERARAWLEREGGEREVERKELVRDMETGEITEGSWWTALVPRYTEEVYDKYFGYWGEEFPLRRFTFEDGRVFEEYEQEVKFSSGPMMFLALREKGGEVVEESLWSEKEIEEA